MAIAALTIRSEIDVKAYCERWVRWAFGGRMAKVSITGKLMDGMRSTVCPTCKGRRRVEGWKVGSTAQWVDPCPVCGGEGHVRGELESESHYRVLACDICVDEKGEPTGEFAGLTCFRCGGHKRRVQVFEKVHPAGIRATRYYGANEDDDPISLLIDRTIAGWHQTNATYWLAEIIIMEYTERGTQEAKARSKRMSRSYYQKNLKEAHERLEVIIKNALTS